MSVSFLSSVRAMFGPPAAFDRPRRAGTPSQPDAHAPGAALGARAIDVAAGDFRFRARHVRFRRGAITAIVGPNGSGKTTLLETLLGFRRGGSDVRVLDVPAERFMRDSRSLRRIGAQLQKVEYPDHLRVSEIVALHRAMYAHTDAAITDALGIAELLAKPCRALSKGQRQRVDLYVALAHRPELAVLDEPFTGLDRRYAGVVIDLLRHRASGTSVAMICHSEEELSVVDDLVWVRDGGVRYQGSQDTLRAELVGDARAVLHCRDEADARALRKRLAALPGVTGVRVSAAHVVEAFGDATLHPNVHRIVGERGIQHLALAPSTPGDLLRLCTEGPTHD
ncbi:TPA: ABC transporter ATP-binding protein [Burkholderia cenocepacia]|uniref:ATP-binding cassette domain-containing protein n=1 Tax=unclassified Burkholderia TaxID=2613784 RepID=UPI00158F3BAF|nr:MULTISPECIES: ABC transporter ATP-binding protein [unclassified Burkholderia]HEF5872532.1 ABC transporter ATP-binding protein [Burkholderia cenocepacia]HEF5876040.1 ABC transporter ATP-binding protein [Burkholderia cenocepacia]